MNQGSDWHLLSGLERAALALTALALVLLVGQHWGMMLSNSDDPWIITSTWEMRWQAASAQGRFWLIPINTLAALPYQSGSWGVANSIKILVNSAVFVLFVAFCSRLTDRRTGLLTGLVWLALIDVSPGYYSPFHGFLLMFNLQFAALFGSFYWYLCQLDAPGPRKLAVGPYLLFAFALLAYEPMLFYSGVFPALYLYRHCSVPRAPLRAGDWVSLCKAFARTNWVLPLVVLAYLLTFFLYRATQPTSGRGLDGIGSLADVAITVYQFSVNGFHLQIKALTNYIAGVSALHTLVLAVVYGLAVGLGCFLLIPKICATRQTDLLLRPWGLAVLGFYVFCPNLLLGLVDAYRRWAAEDPHYVGNYFSAFPLAMVLTLGILSLVGGAKASREKALFLLVAGILASSACDNYMRWGSLAEKNRVDSQLWLRAIDDLRGQVKDRTAPVVVCGLHAPEHVSGDNVYWSGYLTQALGTPVQYFYKNLNAVNCGIRLEFNRYRF